MGRTAIIIHAAAAAKGQTRRCVAFWRMLLALRGKSRHHLHSSSSLSFAAIMAAAAATGPNSFGTVTFVNDNGNFSQ